MSPSVFYFEFTSWQKNLKPVIPSDAGVQSLLIKLDSGFDRNVDNMEFLTFYEYVNFNL